MAVTTKDLEPAACPNCDLDAPRRQIIFNGTRMEPLCFCPHCDGRVEQAWKAQETQRVKEQRERIEKTRAKGWAAECPIRYRDSLLERIPAESMRRVWQNYTPGDSVGLVGASRQGKTRTAFHCLKAAHNARRRVRAINHVEFVQLSKQASRSEPGAEIDLRELSMVDTLLIDDLGKGADAPRALEALWNVIDTRTAHNRAIIWTANGSGEYLTRKLGGEYGQPIIERLREFSQITIV